MYQKAFPVIDPVATGANIVRLRIQRGLSVRDLQAYFGFEEPQAIYKWQKGKSLPSVDNLYALGALLEVPMDEILVSARPKLHMIVCEQQADACCSPHLGVVCPAAVDTAGAYGSRRPFSAPRPGCSRRECRGGVASIAPKGSVYHPPILPGWAGDGDVPAVAHDAPRQRRSPAEAVPEQGIVRKAASFQQGKGLFFGIAAIVAGQAGPFLSSIPGYFGLSWYSTGMVLIGMVTLFVGEIWALRQEDIKRMLAYSTIGQIGEITISFNEKTVAKSELVALHDVQKSNFWRRQFQRLKAIFGLQ